MSLNITNLTAYFDKLKFRKETLILDHKSLFNLRQNYKELKEVGICQLELKKPYGIFAITDSLFNKYSITSFHYVDFRWFSVKMTAKIMHKAHIEEWHSNNGYSMKFSKCPYRYSGDVCGIMRGDYRVCFKVIKEKERLYKLLCNTSIELPNKQNIKIKVQCGLGLESLTIIKTFSNNQNSKFDLSFIN